MSWVNDVFVGALGPGVNNPTFILLNVICGLATLSLFGLAAASYVSYPDLLPHVGFLIFCAIGLWCSINWLIANVGLVEASEQEKQLFGTGGEAAAEATPEESPAGGNTAGDGSAAQEGDGDGSTIEAKKDNSNAGKGAASQPPLQLVDLPGKGRGLVASRNLQPGELLLLCRPLALLYGNPPAQPPPAPQGGRPQAGARPAPQPRGPRMWSEADLVEAMLGMEWGPAQVDILRALYAGPASGEQLEQQVTPALSLQDLDDPWVGRMPPGAFSDGPGPVPKATAAATGRGAAAAAAAGTASPLCGPRLAGVVRFNATGLPSDDVILARVGRHSQAAAASAMMWPSAAAGGGGGGVALGLPYLGVWPAHAMINHSCSPNAVAVVGGGLLAVRCCTPVAAGEEVCITYAGALGLGPLALRRALLERNHAFRCSCKRCMAEERLPPELAQLWGDLVVLVSQQLQPQLAAAAAALRPLTAAAPAAAAAAGAGGAGGGAAGASAQAAAAARSALPVLLQVAGQTAKCCALFEDTLAQLKPPPAEAMWHQAGLYPLYETRARAAQLLSECAAAGLLAAPEQAAARGGGQRPPGQKGAGAKAPQEQAGQAQQQGGQQLGAAAAADAGGAERQRWEAEYLGALSVCLRLQGVANAGSDMHVQLAARYDAACRQHAARHATPAAQQQAAEARQRLQRSLLARYGAPAVAPAGAAAVAAAPAQGEQRPGSSGEGADGAAGSGAGLQGGGGGAGEVAGGWALHPPSMQLLLQEVLGLQ